MYNIYICVCREREREAGKGGREKVVPPHSLAGVGMFLSKLSNLSGVQNLPTSKCRVSLAGKKTKQADAQVAKSNNATANSQCLKAGPHNTSPALFHCPRCS